MILNSPVQVIAEVGSVHDGSFGNALHLIQCAAELGADVVKFQTHIADAETLPDAPSPAYFKSENRFDYFNRTSFSLEQLKALDAHCRRHRIEFMSSPFSEEAVHLLEAVDVSRYKIGSGEITNLPMLEAVARTRKPVLISSGMSTWEELDQAVQTILRHHSCLTILQCTSEYPCPYEDVGLNLMVEMKRRYNLPVGLSDHTLTNYASFAAVTLGASVIERHFTFSRSMYGSDARHSLEPGEFADLVRGIRAITTCLTSKPEKDIVAERLRPMKRIFEKSIVSTVPIPAGATLIPSMLALKKPGTGLPPSKLSGLLGRTTKCAIPANTMISEGDLNA